MTDLIYDFDLNGDNLNQFFENQVAFYRLPRERVSDLLLSQLYICNRLRIHNIFYITDEMKHLEGITRGTRTKKEKPFKGHLLKGLWKKHFYSDRFLPRNLANYLRSERGKKAVDSFLGDAMAGNQADFVEEKTLDKIAYFVTFGAYKYKASCAGKQKDAITGEWLIYGKYKGLNYYLCIARHNAGDERIRSEILNVCTKEFPFLFR
ncbi:MAG TPA: hypothetical protein VK452_06465 [Dissulfurispiraceae bacterium]|nr:hypothetical protein [Dissulfurispiraceae bacterium]